MDSLRVEYLAIVDGAEGFCADVKSLEHLLQSDQSIVLRGNTITFGGHNFICELQPGVTEGNTNRFFHIAVICSDLSHKDTFESLLKVVRSLLYKLANKPPQVLWDELGLHYAMNAYPLIHEVENLLRKLITKFMLTKVGQGWMKDTMPKEVSDSIKKKASATESIYLHDVDFIQLSNYLFTPYTTSDPKRVLSAIAKSKSINDLQLADVKQLIPRSNWDRYFSTLVKCESEFIRIRWERLYELRNQVAHNRSLVDSEYKKIQSLVKEILPIIEDALARIGVIVLSQSEKETVAENVAISRHPIIGEYIALWHCICDQLFSYAKHRKLFADDNQTQQMKENHLELINFLKEQQHSLPPFLVDALKSFAAARDFIVHFSDRAFTEAGVEIEIQKLRPLYDNLNGLIEVFEPQQSGE